VELHYLRSSSNIRNTALRPIRWARHADHTDGNRYAYTILVGEKMKEGNHFVKLGENGNIILK
jgi:hypothetical protein